MTIKEFITNRLVIKWAKGALVGLVLLASVVTIYDFVSYTIVNKRGDLVDEITPYIAAAVTRHLSKQDTNISEINNHEIKLAQNMIDEKCSEYTYPYQANVFRTECVIKLLDRIAAEREWKQRKIETARHPQINKYDMVPLLEDEQLKIRAWREGFENMRDAWCNAKMTFVTGSGTPMTIATCKIEFEALAINDLNNLYYETILKEIYDSKGIVDFEPTEADINALIKVNKTSRGCIWYGEVNCN